MLETTPATVGARDTHRRTYTIGELARRYEVTPRTIRFYEQEGLLEPERRGQTRIYHDKDRVRLKLTLRGKRLGFRWPRSARSSIFTIMRPTAMSASCDACWTSSTRSAPRSPGNGRISRPCSASSTTSRRAAATRWPRCRDSARVPEPVSRHAAFKALPEPTKTSRNQR